MLIARPVVAHGRPVRGLCDIGQFNRRFAARSRPLGGSFQKRERPPSVAPGDADEIVERVGRDRKASGEAAFVFERAGDDRANVFLGKPFERDEQ